MYIPDALGRTPLDHARSMPSNVAARYLERVRVLIIILGTKLPGKKPTLLQPLGKEILRRLGDFL